MNVMWLLLVCNAALAAHSAAEDPTLQVEQLSPVENQNVFSQLPPFQLSTSKFHSQMNNDNYKNDFYSNLDNHFLDLPSQKYLVSNFAIPKGFGAFQAPFAPTAKETSNFRFNAGEQLPLEIKEYPELISTYESFPPKTDFSLEIKDNLDSATIQFNPTSSFEQKNSASVLPFTRNSLESPQYTVFGHGPFSSELNVPSGVEPIAFRKEKPIAVVPFKPPKRKPIKEASQPAHSQPHLKPSAMRPKPPVPTSPSLELPLPNPMSSMPNPLPLVHNPVTTAPNPVPTTPKPVLPVANPSPTIPNPLTTAPYPAPSEPHALPSAPYPAPLKPQPLPSAPYPAPSNAPYPRSEGYVPPQLESVYAPAYLSYSPNSQGDSRNGLFLGNTKISAPDAIFVFTRIHGRGLFDVEDDSNLYLNSGSYSYLSPENVPVYLFDVSSSSSSTAS